MDGSDLTSESLEGLGLDSEDIVSRIESGELSMSDAFGKVTRAIGTSEDAAATFASGVGLMGAPFEDLGQTAVENLEFIEEDFVDVGDAVDGLGDQYDTLGQLATGVWRKIQLAIKLLCT